MTREEWEALRTQVWYTLTEARIGRGKGLRVDLNLSVTSDEVR